MRKAILAAAILAVFGQGRASGETYTMETYYPAPVGVYTSVTVTSGTVLARDGGTVSVGANNEAAQLNVKGQVTVTGNTKVDGVFIPGSFASDPADAASKVEGAIYYNTTTKTHRVYKNAAWAELGGGSAELYSADRTACTASLDGKKGLTIALGWSIKNTSIQMYNNSAGEEFQGSLKVVTCRYRTGVLGSAWGWE